MLWIICALGVVGAAMWDVVYVATGHRLDSTSSFLLLGSLIVWVGIAFVWRAAAIRNRRD